MVPSSTATAVFLTAAASLLFKPALATSSSRLDPDIVHEQMRAFQPAAVVQPWSRPQAPDAAAPSAHMEANEEDDRSGREGTPQSTMQKHEQIVTQESQGDNEYSALEGMELKLRRSEGEREGERAVLRARETSAAPTIFGVSIWLILIWLALLYLMFKTGSMF